MACIPKAWTYEKFKNKIWEHGQELGRVHFSFIRQVLGVHKKSSILALMSETGKYPITLKLYCNIFKYWLRLIQRKKELVYEAYEVNCLARAKNQNSWLKLVDFLLEITNMKGIRPNLEAKDIEKLKKIFTDRLKFLFTQWWMGQRAGNNISKLEFYFRHKRHFKFEPYLDNIPRNVRRDITKFRMSCHCLPIEVQRYQNIPRQERICNICSLKTLGDECHYLLDCTNHKIVECRKKLIRSQWATDLCWTSSGRPAED